jgi:hypothetical protein
MFMRREEFSCLEDGRLFAATLAHPSGCVEDPCRESQPGYARFLLPAATAHPQFCARARRGSPNGAELENRTTFRALGCDIQHLKITILFFPRKSDLLRLLSNSLC